MPRKKKQTFDQANEVRKLARERVGIVKASRPLKEKDDLRRDPKHKKPVSADEE